ncbi:NAD(P)H-dependent oxidoreductase [Algihabitans albus]|uniref:NAD(P)H-dependent oxidoreductase n=1 Tax=Algihabitans albus TaxID=2164067 RepID=UPI000E5D9514|nr:NAD(P)H-dependent oxidoreductase [Algihabitans albus]
MRVHLVHAHPEPASFVAAMRDVIQEQLRVRGDQVTVSDLYAQGFNPVLLASDFGARRSSGHLNYALEQRAGYETGTLSADIAQEVEMVLAADVLAFTFPIFWFSVPAILKGWIERVFLSGPFYGGKRIYGRGGLAGKRAFAALSLGGREHMFGPDAIHGDLETGLLRHFFQGTLGYVGLTVHRPFVAYHTPYLRDAQRRTLLEDLRAYVRCLDEQPHFTMPNLDDFDAVFARRPMEKSH